MSKDEKKKGVKPEVKERKVSTPEQLEEAHLDKVNLYMANTQKWEKRLGKAVSSRKHTMTDRQKAYVVRIMGDSHQAFLDAIAGTAEPETIVDVRQANQIGE